MKIHDYVMVFIMLAVGAVLYWYGRCEVELILLCVWLAIIAVFLILMITFDRKRKMRQEIRREIKRALATLIK